MDKEDFIKSRVKDFKNISLQGCTDKLDYEFSSLRSLFNFTNNLRGKYQLSGQMKQLDFTSKTVEPFELLVMRTGNKLEFNSVLAASLKNEIIAQLRKQRKSFKTENINSAKLTFIECLDFDAIYKNKTDISKLLFTAYKANKVDEINEDSDIDQLLTLEKVHTGFKIKSIVGMKMYQAPVIEEPPKFSWI